jgi:predicted permease
MRHVLGALQGFVTIGAVILVGYLLAHLRVLDLSAQRVLADLAFFVASPALLLTVLAKAPVAAVFSGPLVVGLVSALAVFMLAALAARRWGFGRSEVVMASLCAGYVNSGNLGIPVALYVLGDAAYAAPILLIQLLLFTPVSMALLDAQLPGARPGWGARARSLLRNPITVGALLGLLVSVFQVPIPALVMAPLTLVANLAVPCMLVAFGIGLRLGQRPGQHLARVGTLSVLKLGVQPAAAVGLGMAMRLAPHEVFAAGVMAALPTAQNMYTYAIRYQQSLFLTRDTIFVTTLASAPVILLLALVFRGA